MWRASSRAFPVAGVLVTWVLIGLSPALALAQQSGQLPPISTDRPTTSLSPGTVPRHAFQIESGWTFSRVDNDAQRTDTNRLLPGALRASCT